eukprot:748290-Rhodomonas_salina.8
MEGTTGRCVAPVSNENECRAKNLHWLAHASACVSLRDDGQQRACVAKGFAYLQCRDRSNAAECGAMQSGTSVLTCTWNLAALCETREECEGQGTCVDDMLYAAAFVNGSQVESWHALIMVGVVSRTNAHDECADFRLLDASLPWNPRGIVSKLAGKCWTGRGVRSNEICKTVSKLPMQHAVRMPAGIGSAGHRPRRSARIETADARCTGPVCSDSAS